VTTTSASCSESGFVDTLAVVVNAAVSSTCRNSTEMRRGECVQDEWFLSSSALNAAIGSEPSACSGGRVKPVVVPRVVAGLVDAVVGEVAGERVVVGAAVEDAVVLVAGVVFLALLPHAAVPIANTTSRAADMARVITIMPGFWAQTRR
jgi:hypothetical protein